MTKKKRINWNEHEWETVAAEYHQLRATGANVGTAAQEAEKVLPPDRQRHTKPATWLYGPPAKRWMHNPAKQPTAAALEPYRERAKLQTNGAAPAAAPTPQLKFCPHCGQNLQIIQAALSL